MTHFYILVGLLAVSLLSGCSKKQDAHSPLTETESQKNTPLTIKQAFMYPPVPGTTQGVIYLTARNNTAHPLVVNYVHSPIADRIEVHTHIHEDGLMKMRKVNHFSFQPNSVQLFEPGGYHLMVFDIDDDIGEKSQFDLTFEFEGAIKMTIPVEIKSRK